MDMGCLVVLSGRWGRVLVESQAYAAPSLTRDPSPRTSGYDESSRASDKDADKDGLK